MQLAQITFLQNVQYKEKGILWLIHRCCSPFFESVSNKAILFWIFSLNFLSISLIHSYSWLLFSYSSIDIKEMFFLAFFGLNCRLIYLLSTQLLLVWTKNKKINWHHYAYINKLSISSESIEHFVKLIRYSFLQLVSPFVTHLNFLVYGFNGVPYLFLAVVIGLVYS